MERREKARSGPQLRSRTIAALVLLALAALSGAAQAGVPGWAQTSRKTKVEVSSCAQFAASAITTVTGKAAGKSQRDKNNFLITGFTTNAGIFVFCTAAATNICPNRPAAMLSIVTFSSAGSGDAVTVRDKVNTKFGNPVLIDCN